MSDVVLKRCTACGELFPTTSEFFTRTPATKDGWHTQCKTCKNKRQRERYHNPKFHDQMLADQHARYHRPDVHERALAQMEAFRQAHPEMMRARSARYYQKKGEQVRATVKAYRQNNPGKIRARREARVVSGAYTAQDIREQYKRQKGKCYYCRHKVKWGEHHVEHVVPLSRGGTNDISNIVIACPPCNHRKHNKLPHEWPEGGKLL